MAATVKEESTLSIEYKFADGDTRTANYPNPAGNVDSEAIETHAALATATIDGGGGSSIGTVIIGDKTGANCTGVKTATKITKTTTTLDIPE